MRSSANALALLFLATALACTAGPSAQLRADAAPSESRSAPPRDAPYLVVLGVAQDAGAPQAGTKQHAGFDDLSARHGATSLALVDPRDGRRWLFEATPDLRDQLHALDELAPVESTPGLAGIFLTHAHIGHYLGLAQLGHEVIGAREVPVHLMPRFAEFLRTNGPWDQLVAYGNIELRELTEGEPRRLAASLHVTPLRVPHREEYSEVVAFRIDGPARRALFLPDIDKWERLDEQGVRIEDWIADVDIAYLDGSFFDAEELPGRDLSQIPHPLIAESLKRFAKLPITERAKIRFLHLNHSNPALDPLSAERRAVERAGMSVAERGELQAL